MANKTADELQNWSYVGMALAKQGVPLHCPQCNQWLKGQRYCPQCGMMIKYHGEADESIRKDIRLGKFGEHAQNLSDSSDRLLANGAHINQGCGCLVFLLAGAAVIGSFII